MKVTAIYGVIIFEEGRALVQSIDLIEKIEADTLDACEEVAEHNAGFYGGDWLIPEVYQGELLMVEGA